MTFIAFSWEGRPVFVRFDSIIGFESGSVWLSDGNTITVAQSVDEIKALIEGAVSV